MARQVSFGFGDKRHKNSPKKNKKRTGIFCFSFFVFPSIRRAISLRVVIPSDSEESFCAGLGFLAASRLEMTDGVVLVEMPDGAALIEMTET